MTPAAAIILAGGARVLVTQERLAAARA